MKNLKNLQKHGLAVFALTLALGYGSYSYAKAAAAKRLSTPWYTIQTQGANPNQDVLGIITSDPTQSGSCDTPIDPNRCTVQFFNMFDTNLSGKTVAQAEALLGVNEISRTYKP